MDTRMNSRLLLKASNGQKDFVAVGSGKQYVEN